MEEKEFRERIVPLQRLMYGLALKSGLPPEDAADALQEALLNLWRSRGSIPTETYLLRAYCMTTMRNECVSVMRKRRETLPLETAAEIKTAVSADNAESKDTRRHVEKILDTLPENQRKVIRMSSFGEFSVSEISEATGLTAGNVRQLLSRARRSLRNCLDLQENVKRKEK